MSEILKGHKLNRKLTDEQIKYIKELHRNGISQRKIASLVNSNHTTIGLILKGKAYIN
ncbi:MAG: helix-turn-helix domain-containing protein [Clostridia bacterium]|nr:helix-turn-helix domain-containing protein [Clostridia bacterium]